MSRGKSERSEARLEKVFKQAFSQWTRRIANDIEYSIPWSPVFRRSHYRTVKHLAGELEMLDFSGAEVLVKIAYKNFLKTAKKALALCETPTERLFLSALLVVAQHSFSVEIVEAQQSFSFSPETFDLHLIIEPHAHIGDRRVDFLFTASGNAPDFKHPEHLPPGKEIIRPDGTMIREVPGTIRTKERLIVECEGQRSSRRRKEQLSEALERDRPLQQVDFPVLRFAEADIWHDVFYCVEKTAETLMDMAYGTFELDLNKG